MPSLSKCGFPLFAQIASDKAGAGRAVAGESMGQPPSFAEAVMAVNNMTCRTGTCVGKVKGRGFDTRRVLPPK
jgi:hypothetical protein